MLVVGRRRLRRLAGALDRIWRCPQRGASGRACGRAAGGLVAFGLVLGLGFLLMVSLMVSAGAAAFGAWFGGMLEDWEALLQGLNVLISFGIRPCCSP